jgi:hypothetical protein
MCRIGLEAVCECLTLEEWIVLELGVLLSVLDLVPYVKLEASEFCFVKICN